MVVFEVNPCALGKSHQCQQLIRILPSLQSIGVEVIYLIPFFKKGKERAVGSPYCISNFEELNPAWGSMEDWYALRNAVQENGMTLWMDWVMNHTAWDHPWLIAHSDYYSKNEDGQFHHPIGTNWTDVVQLNHHHPEVLEYFVSNAKNWMELGVTGFRIDASYLMPNDYLNLWIQRVKELSFNTKVILDRWDILEQCSQADGVMAKDEPIELTSANDVRFWKLIYGHDEAAFGSLFSEQYPNGWSLHEAKERHKNIVLGSGQWSPNQAVSFFESRHWDQQSFDDWLQQMRGQG